MNDVFLLDAILAYLIFHSLLTGLIFLVIFTSFVIVKFFMYLVGKS